MFITVRDLGSAHAVLASKVQPRQGRDNTDWGSLWVGSLIIDTFAQVALFRHLSCIERVLSLEILVA